MQRPTVVTVIGWGAVALGALMMLSALGGQAVSSMMPPASEFTQDPTSPFPTWLFDHYTALCLVQIGVAAVMITAGAALLRLRPWARPVLEALVWLLLISLLAFGVTWVRTAGALVSHMPGDPTVPFPGRMFVLMGAFTTLVFAVPMVFAIRALRGGAVRAALLPAAGT